MDTPVEVTAAAKPKIGMIIGILAAIGVLVTIVVIATKRKTPVVTPIPQLKPAGVGSGSGGTLATILNSTAVKTVLGNIFGGGGGSSTPVKSEVNTPSTTGTQYFDSDGNNVTASFEADDYDGAVYDEDGNALSGFSGRLTNQPSQTNLS